MHYHLKDIQDWVAHLEHLQVILVEFDANGTPDELELICFFPEGLRPFIKGQIEQRGRELNSWDKPIEKAIDAKAKAILQLRSSI